MSYYAFIEICIRWKLTFKFLQIDFMNSIHPLLEHQKMSSKSKKKKKYGSFESHCLAIFDMLSPLREFVESENTYGKTLTFLHEAQCLLYPIKTWCLHYP